MKRRESMELSCSRMVLLRDSTPRGWHCACRYLGGVAKVGAPMRDERYTDAHEHGKAWKVKLHVTMGLILWVCVVSETLVTH